MSSAVLYLAIVAVWGIVLVPMWLRRDGDGIGRLLHRRSDATEPLDEPIPDAPDDDVVAFEDAAEPLETLESLEVEPVRRRRVSRGAVIARRRRRTIGLSLLTLTAIIATGVQLAPWWFTIPPALLLTGHLSLLRVAVRMDHARRQQRRRVATIRAAQLRRAQEQETQKAREAEEAARSAEVIELPAWAHEEVYDQYTDLRAVGD